MSGDVAKADLSRRMSEVICRLLRGFLMAVRSPEMSTTGNSVKLALFITRLQFSEGGWIRFWPRLALSAAEFGTSH